MLIVALFCFVVAAFLGFLLVYSFGYDKGADQTLEAWRSANRNTAGTYDRIANGSYEQGAHDGYRHARGHRPRDSRGHFAPLSDRLRRALDRAHEAEKQERTSC